jgi:nicotinamidase-related amidase
MNRLCDATSSMLILIDLQARLMPAIEHGGKVVKRAATLAKAAGLLGVPVIGTEQNPAGLGPNVPEIRGLCDETIPKSHFNASAEEQFRSRLDPQRNELIVAGCEAHVCVMQTVLGLIERGYRVRLVIDATGSRQPQDRMAAIERAGAAGAMPVTTEMVVFEWLRHSDHPAFKRVLELVK